MASLATRIDQALALFRNRFTGRDTGTESFLGKTARAVAALIFSLDGAIDAVDRDIVPTADTTTTGLDDFASVYGVASNGGGYGRNGAVAATGGTGLILGTPATAVNDGEPLIASDGVTELEVDGAVVIGGGGSVSATFRATTLGTAGNLPVGEVLTFVSPPIGVSPGTVTLAGALSGGLDAEEDGALLARILARLQTPPKGGAEQDYKTWIEDGVAGITAYVYPLRSGTGTVDIVITATGGSGTGRVPASATDSEDATEAARPVTVNGVTIYLAYQTSGRTVRVRVEPSAAQYAFEWDDTAANYLVDTYTAGSPATLKLDQIAPDTLKDAIDAGSEPRLQVASSLGPTVAVQVRCTAWADGGGKTTLTLEDPLPDGFLGAVVNDSVYAGGPIATAIGDDLLDYIDSLGPSRISGYAATTAPWYDTINLYQLARIALDAADTDGTKYAVDLVAAPTIDGASLDVQGIDHPTSGPELLYADHVIVTQ